ncbi:alpha/beta hydrolase fold family protein [Mycobacterium ulcerans str. Harvey]|uniref:Carboxylic ester hydrolase n=1 Tax=Mycobacterium ulcerans str. Harvey TaxID=1299332 RepID=A0ABP3AFE4_MYCUL|nr:alpha/beta hydrolase fold family protein [Mycobacterium ulcerans str. Harvey]
MVFIHGGGYILGSSATPIYDGAALARRGCVYVSVNYRLGALGCLDLSSLSTPDIAIDGNLYLRDLVMALQWIQDNIAEFGGDPDNVTIFGESAGAHITATLLAVRRPRSFRPRDLGESGRRYGASAGNRGRIRDTLCPTARCAQARRRQRADAGNRGSTGANPAPADRSGHAETLGRLPNRPTFGDDCLPLDPSRPCAPGNHTKCRSSSAPTPTRAACSPGSSKCCRPTRR